MLLRLLLGAARGGGSFSPPVVDSDVTFHGVRAKFYTGTVPDGQTIPSGTFTAIKYNYTGPSRRCYDTDGFHPVLTDTNLTGTVAKTATSTTVVGTGTAFLTELAVGDPVAIPGGHTYYPDVLVVASIADNTHFTAYQAAKYTASGQTAYLDSSVFVIPPGMGDRFYQTISMYNPRNGAGNVRECHVVFNGFDNGVSGLGSHNGIDENMYVDPVSGGETAFVVPTGPVLMAEGEFCQVFVYHDIGSSNQNAADLVGYPFSMWSVGVP